MNNEKYIQNIKSFLNICERTFSYLEKIEPYEEHEMDLDTPNPDSLWISLSEARKSLKRLEKNE
jgi:hypothetical protein